MLIYIDLHFTKWYPNRFIRKCFDWSEKVN